MQFSWFTQYYSAYAILRWQRKRKDTCVNLHFARTRQCHAKSVRLFLTLTFRPLFWSTMWSLAARRRNGGALPRRETASMAWLKQMSPSVVLVCFPVIEDASERDSVKINTSEHPTYPGTSITGEVSDVMSKSISRGYRVLSWLLP